MDRRIRRSTRPNRAMWEVGISIDGHTLEYVTASKNFLILNVP